MTAIVYAVSTAALVVAIVVWSFSNSKTPREPYGLWHLQLNKLPDDDPDSPPKTEWLNMGYWRDTTIFPFACRALALKLAAAARYGQGASILDVGHGTGESLLLLLSEPSLPKISKLTGITSLEAHYKRSLERVAANLKAVRPDLQQESTTKPGINFDVKDDVDATQVNLYHGDAVFRRREPSSRTKGGKPSKGTPEFLAANSGRFKAQELETGLHPLDLSNAERFDAILVLDCAYHFDTRRAFLEQAFERLNPSGRIALTDLCLSAPPLPHLDTQIAERRGRNRAGGGWNWKLTVSRWLQCLPTRNELSMEEYVRQLEEIGFVGVELEDITNQVFPQFSAFMKGTGWAGWVFGTVLSWFMDAGGRFILVSAEKPFVSQ